MTANCSLFIGIDSFSRKKQTSDLINPVGASRHHFADTCFDFGNPDCSGFVLEDARGRTLSEESCSSTAVTGDISLANSRRRDNRRHHTSDFASHYDRTYRCAKEKQVKNKDDTRCWSGNFTEMPLDPKSGCFLSERIGPRGSWLFEQGYRSSPCPKIERKRPSTAFTQEFLHTSIPEPTDFSSSKHDVFSKFPPSTEKCTSFLPPTQRHCHNSKAEFPMRKPDFSSNSVDSGLESSFTHGDTSVSDFRELGSMSRSNESQPDTPKVKEEKVNPSEELIIENNMEGIITADSKESMERIVDTMLPEKISVKSESSVNGIEHLSNNEEPPPGCEKENKVHLEAETETERNIANRRHGNCLNSSPQLMMLESFVLQLLCVHKVLEPTQ